uniref:Uncharacterized protein n=1 Tax=Anguilla anguilla TaxID=7936 RepID=A0A0E9PLD3_ANGAN
MSILTLSAFDLSMAEGKNI